MWNCFITTSNQNININISECLDFNPDCNSTDAYNYVLDKLDADAPFITLDEVIYIRDKKAIKNIRVHRKTSILVA